MFALIENQGPEQPAFRGDGTAGAEDFGHFDSGIRLKKPVDGLLVSQIEKAFNDVGLIKPDIESGRIRIPEISPNAFLHHNQYYTTPKGSPPAVILFSFSSRRGDFKYNIQDDLASLKAKLGKAEFFLKNEP